MNLQPINPYWIQKILEEQEGEEHEQSDINEQCDTVE